MSDRLFVPTSRPGEWIDLRSVVRIYTLMYQSSLCSVNVETAFGENHSLVLELPAERAQGLAHSLARALSEPVFTQGGNALDLVVLGLIASEQRWAREQASARQARVGGGSD